jgi:FkbH-like protein
VNAALPQVRIYDEKEIGTLLSKPEFDVPVTEAGKSRRKSYLIQLRREHVQEQYGDDVTAFLKSCCLKMRIFIPVKPDQITRCLELVQRSNQLNLSSKRYTRDQFMELLKKPDYICLAFHCTDRFGDYGIVGFSSVKETPPISCVTDLVISCRIAQKRIEHAFIEWLAKYEQKRGFRKIDAKLIKTVKNGPLQCVFNDLPFRRIDETADSILFSLVIDTLAKGEQIIEVTDELIKNR